MMFRSIRWTLFFWYAVILLGSLGALGMALHHEFREKLFRDADARLDSWLETARQAFEESAPKDATRRLVAILPDGVIFSVFGADGRLVAASPNLAEIPCPTHAGISTRGNRRLGVRRSPDGGWLVVGKDVHHEHHRIRGFLVVLLAASAAIVLLALGGGFFLVVRTLRPVRRMTLTAQRISFQNLGERIDTRHIPDELSDLARTLNTTFDDLAASFERQARFTADASHELRTPLATLVSHLELAENKDQDIEELRARISICRGALRRMRSVVEGLLTLARADAGDLGLGRTRVELAPLLDEIRALVEPLAQDRRVSTVHRVEPHAVLGDADRLREALTNIYVNAVRYNRPEGCVTVSLERRGADIVIGVTDTGMGISPEDAPRVFERFFRADKARSRVDGGSGLGLAIARRIIDLHGGEVSFESRPDEGSVFVVRLPALE